MPSHHTLKASVLASDNIDGAVSALAETVAQIGIDRFITGFVRGSPHGHDGSWRLYKHRSHNFPTGWQEGWHSLNAHCPYYHACFDGRVAFDWDSVRARDNLSAFETKAWQYLADFGLLEGFTVPVHAPGHFGFLTVIGDERARGWARQAETQAERLVFVAHVFHAAVRERFPLFIENSNETPLSQRERECLRLAAAGKTTDEVAEILSLSPETVRIYLKRAMHKLSASSRTQAVANALKSGLI